MITTIIIDDQPKSIERLQADLEKYEDFNVVDTATSVEYGKKCVVRYQPDLIFLDIEMPGCNGFEFLDALKTYVHPELKVVFYTAYDHYMLDAIRAACFDYLLKPYTMDELEKVISRIRMAVSFKKSTFEQSMRRLLSNETKFALSTMTSVLFLHCNEVLYFTYNRDDRSWYVTLTSKTTHRLRTTIKSKNITALCDKFITISQDCIVNVEYLASVENNSLRCTLYPPYNDIQLTASRRHYSNLREAMVML